MNRKSLDQFLCTDQDFSSCAIRRQVGDISLDYHRFLACRLPGRKRAAIMCAQAYALLVPGGPGTQAADIRKSLSSSLNGLHADCKRVLWSTCSASGSMRKRWRQGPRVFVGEYAHPVKEHVG